MAFYGRLFGAQLIYFVGQIPYVILYPTHRLREVEKLMLHSVEFDVDVLVDRIDDVLQLQ